MQKAIIIQDCRFDKTIYLDAKELNQHLSDGWKFVSAAPFGCSVSDTGENQNSSLAAAILVILERA